jgi:tetratricopeptide (TPR) repeat protein
LWGHYTRLIELRQLVLNLPARPELRAANLASLGIATQVLGQYDAAAKYYEEAVEAAAQADDPDLQARYIGDLGRLYRNLGDMDKALSCSQQALDSAARRGDREAVGRWQDRLGLVYAAIGRLDEARALHEDAISTAKEFGDRRSEGAALSNLGVVLHLMGFVEEAERAQRDALAQSRAINDRRGYAIILGRLGMLAEDACEFTQALELHEQALAIAQELGERREQSYQLLGMGKARFGLGALIEAERDLRAARDLDVPETSYLAALALSLLLTGQEHEDSSASFADTIRRCEERLSRSAGLFAARYALATAMVGAAVCTREWGEGTARTDLLSPALQQFELALERCDGRGVVAATLRAVRTLTARAEGVEPVLTVLERALATSDVDRHDRQPVETKAEQ